jgi:hypothetical protein
MTEQIKYEDHSHMQYQQMHLYKVYITYTVSNLSLHVADTNWPSSGLTS